MKAIKSDSDNDSDEQRISPGFSGKNRGVTPSVAAPGVTHPSDATDPDSSSSPRIIFPGEEGQRVRNLVSSFDLNRV